MRLGLSRALLDPLKPRLELLDATGQVTLSRAVEDLDTSKRCERPRGELSPVKHNARTDRFAPPSRARLTAVCLAVAAVLAIASCGDDGGEAEVPAPTGGIAGITSDTCGELEYGGPGEAEALIVSDLPMQGDSAQRSEQQVEAIRLALEQENWRAGDVPVGFQVCDDSIAETGLWDAEVCRSNAEAYAGNEALLGVIGTYNSGCAAEMIPVLNEAGVAMISPGNTAVCLTRPSEGCEDGQPESLYESGERNYVRVVPNDAFQGAALAEFVRAQGARRPFILYAADDPTSAGQAANFRGAAEDLGLEVAGFETWDPEASDYVDLMEKVRKDGADAVVLAGLIDQNGAQVIEDKADVLGSNDDLPLVAFDGFSQQTTIDDGGDAARGMFASVTGRVPEKLSGEGETFVRELERRFGEDPVEIYAPYAGEAAFVLLDAISEGGPDRAGVIEALFATERKNGILGDYGFESSGDPTVGPVTIFQADGTFERIDEISPEPSLVSAARH